MPAGFLKHVIEASLPVVKICLLGAVGAGLARAGILDQHGRRTLSKLIYCLFTPALTFSKLAPVLTGQHLIQWMPLVINMLVSVAAGLALGLLLVVVVRPPAAFRTHVVVATALGNAGNLPLVLVAALVRETGGKLFGEQVLSEDLAIAYVAMGIWAATVTHFTIGTQLLQTPAQQQEQQLQEPQQAGVAADSPSNATAKLKHSSSSDTQAPAGGSSDGDSAACVVELGIVRGTTHQQRQGQGIHLQEQQQQPGLLAGAHHASSSNSIRSNPSADCLVLATPVTDNNSSSKEDGSCASCGTDRPLHAVETWAGAWQCPLCGTVNNAAAAQQPAGHSALQQQEQQQWHDDAPGQEHAHLLGGAGGPSSSSDGTWQQQQQQRHDASRRSQRNIGGGGNSSTSVSNSPHSSMLKRAAGIAWDVLLQLGSPPMVGCMLAVAVGLTPPVRDQLFAPEGHLLLIQDCIEMFGQCCIPCLLLMLGATLSKGPGSSCPPLRVVAGVAAARLVLMPLLGTGWLLLAKTAGWYSAPDKMFILVMLIQNSVPTALNVHTLATLYNNKEAEMGAMLFWQYLLACITLPAALSFFLWLLNTPAMSI